MNDWHIQSRAHACQSCNHAFHEGELYHTLLFTEKHDLLRLDICGKCRDNEYADARDRKGFISHWQGHYEPPPSAPPEAIQKDTAETLLRKLVEQRDDRYLAASYILAVMLERKRILRVKEQLKQGGHRIFIYEQPKTGDIFTIPDPDLQLDQLEQVQRQVADLLEHGLATDPSAAAPSAPSGEAPGAASAESEPPSAVESAPETPVVDAVAESSGPQPEAEQPVAT